MGKTKPLYFPQHWHQPSWLQRASWIPQGYSRVLLHLLSSQTGLLLDTPTHLTFLPHHLLQMTYSTLPPDLPPPLQPRLESILPKEPPLFGTPFSELPEGFSRFHTLGPYELKTT